MYLGQTGQLRLAIDLTCLLRLPVLQLRKKLAFKGQMGNAGTFGCTKRHTPYTTVHGEKTDLKIPELHRSSTANTPRESNSRTGFYDSEPLSSKIHHARAAFATTPRAYGAARQTGF